MEAPPKRVKFNAVVGGIEPVEGVPTVHYRLLSLHCFVPHGLSMTRRFVDLSIAIQNDLPVDPPGMEVNIRYSAHGETVAAMSGFFPGLRPEDLPDGAVDAVSRDV